MAKQKSNYAEMSAIELKSLFEAKREELFKLKLKNASLPLKNAREIRSTRRDVARILTFLNMKSKENK